MLALVARRSEDRHVQVVLDVLSPAGFEFAIGRFL